MSGGAVSVFMLMRGTMSVFGTEDVRDSRERLEEGETVDAVTFVLLRQQSRVGL